MFLPHHFISIVNSLSKFQGYWTTILKVLAKKKIETNLKKNRVCRNVNVIISRKTVGKTNN